MNSQNKNKARGLISALLFFITITLVMVIKIFVPDKTYSKEERRYLQQMPEFSLESLKSGKYTSEFENYLNDQFPLRSRFVAVKTLSEYLLMKNQTKGVYFARDGYLIESMSEYDKDVFYKNLAYADSFLSDASKKTISCTLMLVPTAAAILDYKLPSHAPEINQHVLINKACETSAYAADIYDDLYEHNSEYLYYRNDHHWTSLGAYYAYKAYCRSLDIHDAGLTDFDTFDITDNFFGTTYNKSNFALAEPDVITAFSSPHVTGTTYNFTEVSDSIYEMSYADSSDPYSVFLNGNQPFTQISTDITNGRNLLIIKDSYANTFAQFAAASFENVYMIDLRYFKTNPLEYVDEYGITDVLIMYNVKNFTEDKNLYNLKS
ncbi:MAG: DHHW family protein [Oscillospiraceae bacterium]|nr:DHHW family protein [Oscillospiraceae bacterium]